MVLAVGIKFYLVYNFVYVLFWIGNHHLAYLLLNDVFGLNLLKFELALYQNLIRVVCTTYVPNFMLVSPIAQYWLY